MPKFLTEQQVAEITGRSVFTLRKDRHYHKGIAYHKFGRLVRYTVADVEKFMSACRVETTSPMMR